MLINSTVSRITIIIIGYGPRFTRKGKTGLENKKLKSEVIKAREFLFWESSDKIKPKNE